MTCCQIHQHFTSSFFITKEFWAAFMWGYIIVCQKEMSAKSLRKLLVKLTSAIKYLRYCSEMNFFLLVFQKLRVAMLTQPHSLFSLTSFNNFWHIQIKNEELWMFLMHKICWWNFNEFKFVELKLIIIFVFSKYYIFLIYTNKYMYMCIA